MPGAGLCNWVVQNIGGGEVVFGFLKPPFFSLPAQEEVASESS